MVSTPEVFIDKISRSHMAPIPVKKSSDRESLYLFTNVLDVKKKTAIPRFGATKSKRKVVKAGNTPWEMKPKQKGN